MGIFEKIKNLVLNPEVRFGYLNKLGFYRFLSDEKFLRKAYKVNLGKELNVENPRTYNEKIQWLKLHDRNPEYTKMVDKYEMRKYVSERVGEEYIVPLLGVWEKFEDIDFNLLPNQFVLKCTHDSGGLVICRDKTSFDIEYARKKINRCLKTNYYYKWREWPYKNIKPRIIAENYMEVLNEKETYDSKVSGKKKNVISLSDLQKEQGILDYKFMCFNGMVKTLFLDIGVVANCDGHAEKYYRNIYDRDGKLLDVRETRDNYPIAVELPENYMEMVRIAEELSKGFPHLRVDMYNLKGEIKVGELTFYHGSGLSNVFIPNEWDEVFGSWIEIK